MKRRIVAGLLLILMMLAVGCSKNDLSDQKIVSSGGKQVEIEVDLPSNIPEAKLEVVVDGILDPSKSTTVDTSFISSKLFIFNGKRGKQDIRIKLNDQLYKIYEIDFDTNSYKEIKN